MTGEEFIRGMKNVGLRVTIRVWDADDPAGENAAVGLSRSGISDDTDHLAEHLTISIAAEASGLADRFLAKTITLTDPQEAKP